MKSFIRDKKLDEYLLTNTLLSSPNVHIDYISIDESKDNLNDYSLGFNSVVSGNTSRRMFSNRTSSFNDGTGTSKEDTAKTGG
jgi:hypothetical protein